MLFKRKPKKKKRVMDVVGSMTGQGVSSGIGAGIGVAVAGPIGAIGGAVVGGLLQGLFDWGIAELVERQLSDSEKRKVSSFLDLAQKKIQDKMNEGKKLRDSEFFDATENNRSSAEELLEGLLLTAQREYEERKIPYIANLYVNLCLDSSISLAVANSILKFAGELTYRELVILKCITICHSNANIHKKSAYNQVSGLEIISIATDVYTLYQKGIVYTVSTNFLLGPGSINPSDLVVNGVGAFIYQLMELQDLPHDDLFYKTMKFFSNTVIE